MRAHMTWAPCAAIAASLALGCGNGQSDSPVGRPGRDASTVREASVAASGPVAAGPDDWFVDRAAEAGLRFTLFNGMSGAFYFPEMLPGGAGLFDYDGDGDLDVYLVQGQMLGAGMTLDDALFPPSESQPDQLRGRLYRNDLSAGTDGDPVLRFTDVTEASGIDAYDYGMAVATGDIDNDGWVDVYLSNFGENRLFRNNGDGTFEDISRATGTADPGWGVSASFVDYDRDGWLDLYVGNYLHYDTEADRPCTGLTGRRDYCTPGVYQAQADRLYRNLDGTGFADVTATALVGGPFGPALGVVTTDVDDDGWVDIYVANDGAENLLWMNRGDGTLENRGILSGTAVSGDGRPEASMGVDAGDFDNDGDDDLFMTHLPAEGNNLYVNLGNGLFEDRSAVSGLGPGSLGYSGFGAAWVDYDNDGWLDIWAVNGAIEAARGRLEEPFPYDEVNLLFRNLRDGRFEDVTARAGAIFAVSAVSRGAAFGDVDNDGDIDMLVNNLHGPAQLLINEVGNRQHWVGMTLVGAGGRPVLGARVEVTTAEGATRMRRARTDGSYASAHDPRVLVGLGASGEPPDVRVHWPDGSVDGWSGVPVDRWTSLQQGESSAP